MEQQRRRQVPSIVKMESLGSVVGQDMGGEEREESRRTLSFGLKTREIGHLLRWAREWGRVLGGRSGVQLKPC